MQFPHMHVIRYSSPKNVTGSDVPKLLTCSQGEGGKPLVVGFPDRHHRTLVRRNIDMARPRVRTYPKRPERITKDVRRIVKYDLYEDTGLLPFKDVWLDIGTVIVFEKERNAAMSHLLLQSLSLEKRFLQAVRDTQELSCEVIPTDRFVEICLGGTVGVTVPMELLMDAPDALVFEGLSIYTDRNEDYNMV